MLLRVMSPVLLVARVLRVLRDVGLAVLMAVRRVALRLHRFVCLPGNFLIGADLLAIGRRNGRWMSCHGNSLLLLKRQRRTHSIEAKPFAGCRGVPYLACSIVDWGLRLSDPPLTARHEPKRSSSNMAEAMAQHPAAAGHSIRSVALGTGNAPAQCRRLAAAQELQKSETRARQGTRLSRVLSCSPFQAAGKEIPLLVFQAIQHGRC
jgi:hypothetical protein